ncbi:MAG: small multidrug resistance pump [Mycobacterium sp.]|jgi:small multidrug resistance pump|nr:small multidrug resistance pump [Mycobacterium sp.]
MVHQTPSASFGPVRKWALLSAAITIEVAATLSLRASQDHWAWLVVVVAGYVGALVLLTVVLRAGVPIGVTYGIWGALGTAGTAVLAAMIFGDPFTWPIVMGIGLIIAGVLLIEFGSQRAAANTTTP